MALERLQKIIARAGLASRRQAEEWITAGRVRVDGQVIRELGTRADAATARVQVDGRIVSAPRVSIYLALNKPRGYVTTLSDPEHRRTVMELVRGIRERVYPVGRLDYHSEGLLLLTNDGEFAHRILSASSGVPKTYWVKVAAKPAEPQLEKLRSGIMLNRRRTLPAEIRPLPPMGHKDSANPWYEVILREGRQNQIRRMFALIGHPVRKLRRVQIGRLRLGNLQPGECRVLRLPEIKRLMEDSSPGAGPRKAAPRAKPRIKRTP